MPRQPSAEREAQFKRLGALLDALMTVVTVRPLPEELSISAQSRRIREFAGISAALDGLQQGLDGLLEIARHATPEQVAAINDSLARLNEPPLHVLQSRCHRRVRRLLQAKRLRSETDYYLVKGYLDDQTSGLAGDERELAERLVGEYEHSGGRPEA